MPTKGRARGRKQAEKTQENVVDSTTASLNGGENIEESTSQPLKTKKASKRNEATKEDAISDRNPTPDPELPAKRSRGRVAKEPEVVPKPKRSTKKQTVTNGVDKSSIAVEEEIVKVAPPKKEKGKITRKRGAIEEVIEDENAKPPAEKQRQVKSRSRKAASPVMPEILNKKENSDTEAVVQPKKGRSKATPVDSNENGAATSKKPIKTAGAKKMMVESSGGKGRKRGANASQAVVDEPNEDEEEEKDDEKVEEPEPVKATKKRKTEPKAAAPKKKTEEKVNKSETNYTSINFDIDKEHNFKISSWNVAGIRAWVSKNGTEFVKYEKPDILCLQEIKCIPDLIPEEARLPGYHPYWLCMPGGHGGVAIYSKIMPINVEYGIGDDQQDSEGRIITAEYEKFFLICVYVPNAGRKLVTLPKRLQWNTLFDEYVQKLNAKKPVIICGDMNVAHTEIDLKNPKTNKKNAGFTQEERDGMTNLLSLGYVDTFRYLYPSQENAYTFWSFMGNARSKNVGWRLDYFIVSERFIPKVVDNIIRSEVLGSDHCPITLALKV